LSSSFLNSIDEFHAGTDHSQESGAIQPAPALLGHIEQFECHEQSFGSRACALVTRWRKRRVANADSIVLGQLLTFLVLGVNINLIPHLAGIMREWNPTARSESCNWDLRSSLDLDMEICRSSSFQRPVEPLQAADFASWHIRRLLDRVANEPHVSRDSLRWDFKELFSRVPIGKHHRHFAMTAGTPIEARTGILRRGLEAPSLVKFCHEYGHVPERR
jgi:hypothetical protein